MTTWSEGMWFCMIGVGIMMLIASMKFSNKIEELHHRKLFKLMKNSSYIMITEHLLETSSKRERKRIRAALNHILLFPEPFFEDNRICKEDMEKIKPLEEEWRKHTCS